MPKTLISWKISQFYHSVLLNQRFFKFPVPIIYYSRSRSWLFTCLTVHVQTVTVSIFYRSLSVPFPGKGWGFRESLNDLAFMLLIKVQWCMVLFRFFVDVNKLDFAFRLAFRCIVSIQNLNLSFNSFYTETLVFFNKKMTLWS